MAAYFFDSSAIIKRYVNESGTSWVQNLTDPAARNLIYLASITGVEVVSALTRRARGGSLPLSDAASAIAEFRKDLANDYFELEITSAVIARAMQLQRPMPCAAMMRFN
ncbi:MAG TPA: type II toxin-antitoxin system VapC family toxin [Blastocatellia bacterium]|nr:type II toxin-antitoxin system VapC family toxin [Blastocatellia bacterium]